MERQTVQKVQKTPARVSQLHAQSARSPSGVHPLLELQRSIGNQAVQRLIRSPYIQTKLQVSTPGDPFEQEADRVADTVMRMTEPEATEEETQQVQAKPPATQITPLVQRESGKLIEEEQEKTVAAKFAGHTRVPLAVREDDDEEKVAREVDTNAVEEEEITPAVQREVEQPIEEEKEEGVAVKPVVQRAPLAVREDDDEEKIAPKLETSPAPQDEKETTVAAKPLREDDDEEKIAPKLDSSPVPLEGETAETVQTKLANDTPLQRQTREDEDKKEQILQTAPPIQRQMEDEEHEGALQTKLFASESSQLPGISPVPATSSGLAIQRLCAGCESETTRLDKLPTTDAGTQLQRKDEPGAAPGVTPSLSEEAPRIQAKPLATQITSLGQRESEPLHEDDKEENVATKPVVQRAPLAVREDEDEEKVAPKLESNAEPQEDAQEKRVQAKSEVGTDIQRQTRGDEENQEEALQTAPPIQRQMEEEDEEVIQASSLSISFSQIPRISKVYARPSGLSVQRLCAECEEDVVQTKRLDNRLIAFKRPQVQRKEEPTPAPQVTTSVSASIRALQGGGSPLPPATRAFFEPRFGANFSQVRVHTGGQVSQAASDINAIAFTHGRHIFFGEGQFQPGTAQGDRLLAHELTHTVQQGGAPPAAARFKVIYNSPDDVQSNTSPPADTFLAKVPAPQVSRGSASVVARLPIMGPIGGASPDPSPTAAPGGTAKEYVEKHGAAIIQGLYGFMNTMKLPLSVPNVTWTGTGNQGFTGQFSLQFFMKREDPWGFIVSTTAGADTSYKIDYLIDKARDRFTIPQQAMEWNNGVVLELGNVYLRLLTESLARIVPRFVLVWNQRVLAEEKRRKTDVKKEPVDPYKVLPASENVRSSHPIDKYVIKALWDHLAVDFAAYRKANPTEAAEHDIADSTLRKVTLQILPKQLNWVRVTEPDKPTAEEVANELYESETMAHLIIPARPLFGFQMGPDEWPKLKEAYRQQISSLYTGPFHPGTKVPMIKSPEEQLSGSLGEEAALNQAAGVKPKAGTNRETVIQRMRIIVGELVWLKDLVKKWGLDGRLDAARQKVDERSKTLAADKAADAAAKWAGQTEVQLEVLGMVRNAVTIAANTEKQFTAFPATSSIILKLVWDYVEAASLSDLAATARAKLAQAELRSKMFPADMLEAFIAQLRPAIQTAMIEKTGKSGASTTKGSYAPERYGAGKLAEREAKLRFAMARVREVLLAEPDKAKAELDRILKEVTDLSTEVSFVSNMDNCETAWQALHDNLTTLGKLGPNSKLQVDMVAVNEFHAKWKEIYGRWLSAKTPEDKEKIEKELREKTKSPEWTSLFNRIGEHIEDAQTWNKWVTFGVMVGIAIVTGGLGAYVETLAGAAWGTAAGLGAATLVEATAFTSMSYLLVTKDPTLAGFMGEIGKSILMFGGLKAVGKIYTVAVGEVAAASTLGKLGGILSQFAAVNGVALLEADKAKREKTGGKEGLTEKEILEISLGNLAFIAAVALGARLAEPFLATVTLRGQAQGELIAVRQARATASKLATKLEASKGKGVSRAETQKLLELNNKALEKETRFLEKLQEKVKLSDAGKESGLDPKDVAEIKKVIGEHAANKVELLRQQIAMSLETQTPNNFLCPEKMMPRIVDFYTNVEKVPVRQVGEADALTGAKTVEVAPKDQTPFRITERSSKPIASDVLAEGPAEGGHLIRIRREGVVEVCSDCANIGLVFREVLNQNPEYAKTFEAIKSKAKNAEKLMDSADAKAVKAGEKLAKEAYAEARRLQAKLAETGIEKGGVRFRAEPDLLGKSTHGLEWSDADAIDRARRAETSQGRFGSIDDIQYAVEQAAQLGPGKNGTFPLPAGTRSVIFVWDGVKFTITKVPATQVFVKVRADGRVHAFPKP